MHHGVGEAITLADTYTSNGLWHEYLMLDSDSYMAHVNGKTMLKHLCARLRKMQVGTCLPIAGCRQALVYRMNMKYLGELQLVQYYFNVGIVRAHGLG